MSGSVIGVLYEEDEDAEEQVASHIFVFSRLISCNEERKDRGIYNLCDACINI